MTLRKFLLPLLVLSVLFVGAPAKAEQFYIVYSDSGIAWRIGFHDHESQRAIIEQQYAIDIQNAKNRYANAVDDINRSGISGPDYTDEMNVANQQLQDDLLVASNRRIDAYDSIYPNRWNDFGRYPDFVLVGYTGPCRFCAVNMVGLTLDWFSFLLPYPGYNKPCLFGWHWGDRHRWQDIQPARAAFRANTERRLHRNQSAVDIAFHNANRFVQTRHRSENGRTQNDDVKFMSDHHVPPPSNPNAGRIAHNANSNPRGNRNSNSRGGDSRGTSNSHDSRGGGSRGDRGRGH